MEAKRTNKLLKVSKRTSKFALLEDQPAQGLTHRGQKISDLKEFNDINFASDEDD
jgi:nucleolar protein 14